MLPYYAYYTPTTRRAQPQLHHLQHLQQQQQLQQQLQQLQLPLASMPTYAEMQNVVGGSWNSFAVFSFAARFAALNKQTAVQAVAQRGLQRFKRGLKRSKEFYKRGPQNDVLRIDKPSLCDACQPDVLLVAGKAHTYVYIAHRYSSSSLNGTLLRNSASEINSCNQVLRYSVA